MRRIWWGVAIVLLSRSLLAGQADWAKEVKRPGIRNFYKISDTLYRSYQPEEEGMKEVEKLGIKTVVNLRHFHDDSDELEGTKLRSVHIKTDAWKGGIKEEHVLRFLRVVTDPVNQPVLVHCKHGADRTGTMSAVYRIVVQGWSKDDAIEEMTKGPYGYHAIWTYLPRFVRGLDVDAIKEAAGLNQHGVKVDACLLPAEADDVMKTDPRKTMEQHGQVLHGAMLSAFRNADGIYLGQGRHHLVRVANTGPMRVRWRGLVIGDGPVLLQFWNGKAFEGKDLRPVKEPAVHEIKVDRPTTEPYVYLMAGAAKGQILTDTIDAEPVR